MATQGITVVDFGTGKPDAATTVTGQTGITADTLVDAWLTAKATGDHSIDEHRVEEIDVTAGNIQAGASFTIYAKSRNVRLFGTYSVAWVWNS